MKTERLVSRLGVSGAGNVFTGTWALVGFNLRRDRLRLPVWIAGIGLFTLMIAASFPDLYPTAADRQARADLMSNPTGIAFTGPGHGLDDYTFGAMLANEMLSFIAIVVALMSIFTVVRYTRADEESGRTELVRATVVGRHADTAAALVVAAGANVVIGVLLAGGLPAIGAELDASGSLLFAASLASVGVVFAGIAGLSAQLIQSSRGANGLGGLALAAVFTLRAAGDIGDGTLSWLSPIGWAQATRSFVDERWWPLGLSLVLSAVLVFAALILSDKRDVGAGLVPPRPGQGRAYPGLGRPFGLALRLQRGILIGWGAGLFGFGLMYGSFLSQVEEFAASNEFVQEWLLETGGPSFAEAFAAQVALIMAMLVGGFAIQSALRPRSEETGGRAEPVLATGVGRRGWAGSHLVISLAGSMGILLLSGFGLGLTAAMATGENSWIPRMMGATLVHTPAVWLLVGLAVALFGVIPRLIGLAWAVLGYAVVVGFFGALLGLPRWLISLTPFGHTPQAPAAELTVAPLLALGAIAVALIAAGLYGIRRRDVGAA